MASQKCCFVNNRNECNSPTKYGSQTFVRIELLDQTLDRRYRLKLVTVYGACNEQVRLHFRPREYSLR